MSPGVVGAMVGLDLCAVAVISPSGPVNGPTDSCRAVRSGAGTWASGVADVLSDYCLSHLHGRSEWKGLKTAATSAIAQPQWASLVEHTLCDCSEWQGELTTTFFAGNTYFPTAGRSLRA